MWPVCGKLRTTAALAIFAGVSAASAVLCTAILPFVTQSEHSRRSPARVAPRSDSYGERNQALACG
jgi:hypothetical protein